jgi:hypothetical protein
MTCLELRGGGGTRWGRQGREMTQIMYAHVNKKIIIKKKKMWHIYTMEFYSAIKTNEVRAFADK